jgi:hypothetical protein
MNLEIVETTEEDQNNVPPDTVWHCIDCEWTGLVQDCPTEPEPIGFAEGPWVDMPICPDCGDAVDF